MVTQPLAEVASLVAYATRTFNGHVREQGAVFGAFLGSSWAGGLLHFVYLLLMARFLRVEDYGLLLALLSILTLATLPAGGLDLLAARAFAAPSQHQGARPSLGKVTTACLVWGMGACSLVLLLTPLLSRMLDMQQESLIVLVALTVLCAYPKAMGWGILRGQQRFLALSLTLLLFPALRIGLGLALVLLGLGAEGALLGTLAAVALTAGVALALGLSRGLPRERPRQPEVGRELGGGPEGRLHYGSYSLMASIVTVALALPGTLDVVAVKAMASAQEAGLYSMASTVGKAGILAAMTISVFTFPKIVARVSSSQPYGDLMQLGLGLAGALSAVLAVFLGVAAPLLVPLVFGQEYLPGVGLLRWYSVVAIPFSLVVIVVRSHLAADRYDSVRAMLAFTLALVAALVAYGSEPLRVVLAFGAVSTCYLLWSALSARRTYLTAFVTRNLPH